MEDTLGVEEAIDFALRHSRGGRAIVEEYIDAGRGGETIEAEISVLDGAIVSWGLLSAVREDEANGLVPAASVHPPLTSGHRDALVRKVLRDFVASFRIENGPMNIEMIVDSAERVFILDAGPRNGGYFLPRFFSVISGDDIVEATLRVECGELPRMRYFDGARDETWVQHIVQSQNSGVFRGLRYSDSYESALVGYHPYVEIGETGKRLSSAGDALGVAFLRFPAGIPHDEILRVVEEGCEVCVI